ncbi:hypothetical protein BJX99DRAFT_231611 [Aspergillus californicus]
MPASALPDGKIYTSFRYDDSPTGNVVASFLSHSDGTPVQQVRAFVAPYKTNTRSGTGTPIVIGIQLVYEDKTKSHVLGDSDGPDSKMVTFDCDTINSMTIRSADRIDSISGQDDMHRPFHVGNEDDKYGIVHPQTIAGSSGKLLGFHGTWTSENTVGARHELVSLGAIFRTKIIHD